MQSQAQISQINICLVLSLDPSTIAQLNCSNSNLRIYNTDNVQNTIHFFWINYIYFSLPYIVNDQVKSVVTKYMRIKLALLILTLRTDIMHTLIFMLCMLSFP